MNKKYKLIIGLTVGSIVIVVSNITMVLMSNSILDRQDTEYLEWEKIAASRMDGVSCLK